MSYLMKKKSAKGGYGGKAGPQSHPKGLVTPMKEKRTAHKAAATGKRKGK